MAVKLRLKRVGAKKRPQYRVVAIHSKTRRDGREIEIVGYYDPRNKENNKLNKEGKAGANPGSQSNAPNGTHPTNCNLAPGGPGANYKFDWAMYHSSSEADFQEYIKETYLKNSPELIWEGNLTHEQSHMKTCREQTKGGNKNGYKDYMNDPENYQKDEISAYDAQINKLEKWLKDNCR